MGDVEEVYKVPTAMLQVVEAELSGKNFSEESKFFSLDIYIRTSDRDAKKYLKSQGYELVTETREYALREGVPKIAFNDLTRELEIINKKRGEQGKPEWEYTVKGWTEASKRIVTSNSDLQALLENRKGDMLEVKPLKDYSAMNAPAPIQKNERKKQAVA